MKPIIVAVCAASLFIIPFDSNKKPQPDVRASKAEHSKVTPVRFTIEKSDSQSSRLKEAGETFLHSSMFLPSF